uniref:Uncharacterized protein n=1 Tax=Panagrolaimus sp. ES5 TaxID=591445 RepID=A0AC34F9P9_9BILA
MFSQLKILYENRKQLLGFISSDADGSSFYFFVVNSITEKLVTSQKYEAANAKELLNEIPTLKDLFKAIIIDLFEMDLSTTHYKISYTFCEKLRELLNHCNILHYFISEETHLFTCFLIAAKIDIKFEETVLMIITYQKKYTPKFIGLKIGEFKFTPAGYQLVHYKDIATSDVKASPELLRRQICDGLSCSDTPQNVIVSSYRCKKVPFKKIFKTSKNFIMLNEEIRGFLMKALAEECKWLCDKSYIKYHILPSFDRSLCVYGCFGTEKHIMDILKININEPLPFTKTTFFPKGVPHIEYESRLSKFCNVIKLPSDCHGIEIAVTVDEENFEKIDLSKLYFHSFEKIPLKLNSLLKSKIPFIGFYDNSSVIAINEKSNGYEFLKEWNGMYGIDCFISFDEKKPKFGKEAMEVLSTKNTFVVFDLIKIMSMPPNDIKTDQCWGFKFTKDCNNPVLLQFNNFDGKIKEASPAFLMALFLRQHLKAIQAKNDGEKPKEIAIWIKKLKFNAEEYQRVQEGISKSCELLQIDCFFFDVEI